MPTTLTAESHHTTESHHRIGRRRLLGAVFFAALTSAALLPAAGALAQGKPPMLAPLRLSSCGDSMTEAIDAELPLANHWASWSNGYRNFWTWLLGLSDVQSHHQRIQARFGKNGTRNYIEAKSGASASALDGQTRQSVAHQATYVTILMGHNDVCHSSFSGIPTDAEFEALVRRGLDNLSAGLPDGAVVYLVGIVDIIKLYQLGEQLTAFGFLDCRALWALTEVGLFPCQTMLSPLLTDAERNFTRGRNLAFNRILARLAGESQRRDPKHYYYYTDAVFRTDFVASDVSTIDCFHPSARGQRRLAAVTWLAGPFGGGAAPR